MPEWLIMIRDDFRPSLEQIKKLESLRKKYKIPHDALRWRILSSPAITRRLQWQILEEMRAKMPGTSEKELWKSVLISRLKAEVASGFESPNILKNVDEIINRAQSFDDVCNYIVGLDQKEPSSSDPLGIGKMIDEILEE